MLAVSRASDALRRALPIEPTCLSLIGMDESDMAQLRHRIGIVRHVRKSLRGDLRLICHDSGANAMWFMQKESYPINDFGIDVLQSDASIYVRVPKQHGMRGFKIEADISLERQHTDEKGADFVLDILLEACEAALALPHGGCDHSPEHVVAAARRSASIIGALHAAEGRKMSGTCVYVPRTPWRQASVVRHKSEGNGSFLRKETSEIILSDEPVCVSLSKTEDDYHLRGLPNRHVIAGTIPDPVEALRILSELDRRIDPSKALVPQKAKRP